MQVKLSQAEIEEAVREWCNRRGITVTKDNKVGFTAFSGGSTATSGNGWGFHANVDNITVPPKDGPYR